MDIDLNELERLARSATPGPWFWTNNEGWAYPQTQVKTEAEMKTAVLLHGRRSAARARFV